MSVRRPEPRGRYFEDFEVGEVLVTGSRTVTEADIVNFACLSGDFNDVHVNREYCRGTPFGEPIAHGTLVFAISSGLHHALGMNDGTLLAFLGLDKWRIHGPVRSGDTIYSRSTILRMRQSRDPGRGIVVFRREILKHPEERVHDMEITVLFRRRGTRQASRKRGRKSGAR